jgi:CRP-like cAMP-binding protein
MIFGGIMKKYRDVSKLKKYIEKYNLRELINENLEENHEFFEFKKGEQICKLGEKIEDFYIFLEGTIKVFTISVDGKILCLRIFDSITNLGDIELFTETRYRCNVEAISDSLCVAFPIDMIRNFGLNNSVFLKYLCIDLCNKFDAISSISSNNILYPLKNRLIGYILEYMCKTTGITEFPFSYKELAEMLGVSYRHLSRSINELEEQGFIKKTRNKIEVLNEDALKIFEFDTFPHKID